MSRTLPLVALALGLIATGPAWAQEAQTPLNAANETCRTNGPNDARIEACTYVIANAQLTRSLLTASLSDRGQAHRMAGNREAAMADFDAALTIDPEYGFAWMGRGLVLSADGQTDAALEAFDKATQFNPRLVTPYVMRSNVLFARSDYDGVVADADRMLVALPDNATAYRLRGRGRQMLNQLDTALADLDTAVRLAPTDAVAFDLRGQTHERRGDDLRAFADYDRALSLAPDTADYQYRRGKTLHRMGRYADALVDFEAINLRVPSNPTVLSWLCWSRAVWGQQLDQALEACTRTIGLEPETSNHFGTRAMVHLKSGDLDAALADFDTTLRLNAESHYARYGRGLVFIRQGREAEGRAEIAAALAGDPEIAETYAGYGVPAP